MNPREYEEYVCRYFEEMGYQTELTAYTNDYGLDILATKTSERVAIQVKMYGNGRKINRQMIMELHGVKDFFDCNKAIIATDGRVLADAVLVAEKLKIEILHLEIEAEPTISNSDSCSFESIWEQYIMPLQGCTLQKEGGKTNIINKVDWGGIERTTSNGKNGKIKIEIFKYAVNKLLKEGSISRDDINQNYPGRASSGIVLILSQVPFFKPTRHPTGLKSTLSDQ